MAHGTVKFFNAAKGFGFITGDEDGKDVFVPATTLASAGMKDLKAGQRVTYEAKADPKGSKAVDLKIVAGPASPPKQVATANMPRPHATAPALVTVYIDPESDAAEEVVAAVRAGGHQPRIIDYIGATPTKKTCNVCRCCYAKVTRCLCENTTNCFWNSGLMIGLSVKLNIGVPSMSIRH